MAYSSMDCGRSVTSAKTLETIYEVDDLLSSSSEPSVKEWSSLIFEVNPKIILSKQGKYSPGSGEICAKYIALSNSEVLRHPYYNYPSIKDPGIVDALLKPEPPKYYGSDGQDLYLELCDKYDATPVRDFHRGLLKNVINLRYYCVNPDDVCIMCEALKENQRVQRLDLTSSFLNLDACLHLSQLLAQATSLQELVLAQCRIGPAGMSYLMPCLLKRPLAVLDLSKNRVGDDGLGILADIIFRGAKINKLNLSYNGLTLKGAIELSKALTYNIKSITHLDLSWNEFYTQRATKLLITALCESLVLEDLDLSWNAITGGDYFALLLGLPKLRRLNFSNNKLTSTAINALTSKLRTSRTLQYLDLSGNPLSPTEAFNLLIEMRRKTVKLNNLIMDDVVVSKEFAEELPKVLSLKHRQNTNITHGKVMGNYTLAEADMRTIVMRRLYYLGKRGPKKGRIDIAEYFLTKRKKSTVLIPKQMQIDMKMKGSTQFGEDIINELAKTFPGPKIDKKNRAIDLEGVADYVARMWPDAKALPTPPRSMTSEVEFKVSSGKENKQGKVNKGKADKGKKNKVSAKKKK